MFILFLCISFAVAFTSALNRGECSPPIFSHKIQVLCTQRNLKPISCDEPVPSGTRVYFQCLSPPYRETSDKPNRSYITCNDGKWDAEIQDYFCELVCGERTRQEMEVKSDGSVGFYNGEFPWHIAVYANISGSWRYGCGATLISRKAVVTSANCLVNFPSNKGYMSPDSLLIAAGKYRMDLNETDKHQQIRKVMYVYVGKTAKERTKSDQIGFLVLEQPIKYNAFVRPICLDLESDFEDDQLHEGSIGVITGWDVEWKFRKDGSDTLKISEVPFVDRETCREQPGLMEYVTSKSFCAGRFGEEMKICKGDGGGGMYFYRSSNRHYYLRGVIIGGAGCRGFILLTKISAFSEMVKYFADMEELNVNDLESRSFESSSLSPSYIIQFSGEELKDTYLGKV